MQSTCRRPVYSCFVQSCRRTEVLVVHVLNVRKARRICLEDEDVVGGTKPRHGSRTRCWRVQPSTWKGPWYQWKRWQGPRERADSTCL